MMSAQFFPSLYSEEQGTLEINIVFKTGFFSKFRMLTFITNIDPHAIDTRPLKGQTASVLPNVPNDSILFLLLCSLETT